MWLLVKCKVYRKRTGRSVRSIVLIPGSTLCTWDIGNSWLKINNSTTRRETKKILIYSERAKWDEFKYIKINSKLHFIVEKINYFWKVTFIFNYVMHSFWERKMREVVIYQILFVSCKDYFDKWSAWHNGTIWKFLRNNLFSQQWNGV